MSLTRHCHQCGWVYPVPGLPGRFVTCHQCGADLKVCLNCVHYDRGVAYQCRERRADPVQDKHMANFCEYFDFLKREWVPRGADQRAESARDSLKKLLG